MAVNTQQVTERFALYNGDACEVLPMLKSESVGISIYSPPFAELYNYSSSERDLSNCANYDVFLEHYDFVVRETFRLIKPGRLSVVHCMDLKAGRFQRDFPGDIVRLHERAGFAYHSRRTVWKDPLRVALRTRQLGLMHRQLCKDSAVANVAGADFILSFVKPGENSEPIEHPTGLHQYAGEERPPVELVRKYRDWKDPKTNRLSHWIWRRYASSVWMDIRAGRVLPFRQARESEDEKHACPLQLDVIERILTLWSNPGDVVLTPFLGVGSEAYCAVRMGRRAVGIELKETYYAQAVRNVAAALKEHADEENDLLDAIPPDESMDDGAEEEMA